MCLLFVFNQNLITSFNRDITFQSLLLVQLELSLLHQECLTCLSLHAASHTNSHSVLVLSEPESVSQEVQCQICAPPRSVGFVITGCDKAGEPCAA